MATHNRVSSIGKPVSLPDDLAKEAIKRAESLGFSRFSAYIQSLVREDVRRGGAMIIRDETAYKIGKKPKKGSE